MQTQGPLRGLRFIEMAGLGPVPFAAMVLADLGAEGLRIDSPRPGIEAPSPRVDTLRRGRRSVRVDIATPEGAALVRDLSREADLLLEGFRPGVMERRGLGPDDLRAVNPRLVYGRMTGWGQDGPLARRAGHDLTYVAIAGVLAHIGRRGQPPTPPLNLVGDFGGGSMLLVSGVLAALWEAQRSGLGQVVDTAMVDGAALLMSMTRALQADGVWSDEVGVNLLDSGVPFYDIYRTKDDRWLVVACLEPKFYEEWLEIAGIDPASLPAQYDSSGWPIIRETFEGVVAGRTQAEWDEMTRDRDACVAPVLTMREAVHHPHLSARGTFVEVDGMVQASPAPRFDRTPAGVPGPIPVTGADADTALPEWGIDPVRIAALRASGALG